MNKVYLKKVKAFTLTEVIVVLIIATIVVGIAFTVLNLVQKNFLNISETSEKQRERRNLELAMHVDFNNCSSVQLQDSSLRAVSPIKKEQYTFYQDSIVTSIKKYVLKTRSIQCFFKGAKITTGKVDAIKIQFEDSVSLKDIFVYKLNDPTVYSEYGY